MTALFEVPSTHPRPRPDQPSWVTAYAQRTGADPALIGTRAIPRRCRTCHHWTLTGYDNPVAGCLATVDPYLATTHQEAAAILLARPTYRLHGTPGHYELDPRTPFPARPTPLPPADTVPVVITHICHRAALATRPLPAPRRRTHDDVDVIPY